MMRDTTPAPTTARQAAQSHRAWQAERTSDAARIYAEMEAARAAFRQPALTEHPHSPQHERADEGRGAFTFALLAALTVGATLVALVLMLAAHSGGF